MSRCGPRAQTTDTNTGTDQTPPSMAPARLDDEAEAWIDDQWQQMKDAGHPVSKRYLRQKLVAEWARELADESPSPVLTYLTRHGSVPVDTRVGEFVAGRLAS